MADQQEFENALDRIGFGQQERDASIQASGCVNIAMVSLSTVDQIKRVCKWLNANLNIPISAMQEQLPLPLQSWVIGKQRLRQIIDPAEFTTVFALNQAQIMRQQLEDEARGDGETLAKAPRQIQISIQLESIFGSYGDLPQSVTWLRSCSIKVCD
jgi:hypothetical protein